MKPDTIEQEKELYFIFYPNGDTKEVYASDTYNAYLVAVTQKRENLVDGMYVKKATPKEVILKKLKELSNDVLLIDNYKREMHTELDELVLFIEKELK